ncbi:anti-sigma factor antagonist [Pseudonocardiaceae bacterium YIM PH 21723]|nr:anti-sigma factor antagonist [Pseudonocardiaceae bacterium YIM PH 21723]
MPNRPLTTSRHAHSFGATVVVVAGELDLNTAQQLTDVLHGVEQSAGTSLIVDLSALTYCDSTGITVLANADQAARKANMHFILASPSPDLMRVFRIVGLDQMFTFQPSVQDAFEAVRSWG